MTSSAVLVVEERCPPVTVIMPIRNEGSYISASLGAVLDQDYPQDRLEVIVADGMSTDQTREIIHRLQESHPNLRLLDNPRGIVPSGMNLAIRHARGEIIVRVDGHTLIARDYVRRCVEGLRGSPAQNVGGKMSAVGKTPFGEAVALATSSRFGVGGARFHYSNAEEYVDTVYMGAWWRRVFDRIGLFDEELVRDQDDEFNYRLAKHGGKILLRQDIRSTYTVRSTPRGLWRQYFQYGFWKVRVLQKHPRQMSPRQFIPPFFAAALLGSSFLAALIPYGWVLLALVAGSYLLANLAASTLVAARVGWKYLLILPHVFVILHLGYGLGFLAGLLRFVRRWKIAKPTYEFEP